MDQHERAEYPFSCDENPVLQIFSTGDLPSRSKNSRDSDNFIHFWLPIPMKVKGIGGKYYVMSDDVGKR